MIVSILNDVIGPVMRAVEFPLCRRAPYRATGPGPHG